MRALFILLWFGFTIYGVTDIVNTPAQRCRYLSKSTWAVIAVLLPIIGTGAWLYFGKVRVYKPTKRRMAPDDDPEYLASIRVRRPQTPGQPPRPAPTANAQANPQANPENPSGKANSAKANSGETKQAPKTPPAAADGAKGNADKHEKTGENPNEPGSSTTGAAENDPAKNE